VHSNFLSLHTLSISSPLSSPTSPLSHFTASLPFPKEMNKILSYRRQNELNIIKRHERKSFSEHILFLSVRQSRLAGGIMFLTHPFVRLSVCLLPTCEHYTLKMNEPISTQNGTNVPRGKGLNGRPQDQEVKGQGHRRPKLFGSLAEISLWIR